MRDSVVGQVTGSTQPAANGERYWLWMSPDAAGETDLEKRKQKARGCTVMPGTLGGPRAVLLYEGENQEKMTARLVEDLQERNQTARPEDLIPQLYPTADGTGEYKRSALMPDLQQLEAAQKKMWEGISPEEAEARQAKYGPNKLPVGACARLLPVCPAAFSVALMLTTLRRSQRCTAGKETHAVQGPADAILGPDAVDD